jgi:vitamin B12 transporter
MSRLAALVGGACCLHARAQAQESATQVLPPVVVSASTFAQPLSQALPSTSVITHEQIVQSGARNLTTLLQRVAGVQLTFNGGPGQTSTTFVRGFGSTDMGVLVLLDGVPLGAQDDSGSTGYLQNLSTDQIQRIEIVRGNVSAIYGSGAIGGVILITTREGSSKPRASVSAMAGSQDTTALSADASGQIGRTRVQAGWSRYVTQGMPSLSPPLAAAYGAGSGTDGYRNDTRNASIVQQLAAGHSVGLRAFRSDGVYDYSNGSGSGQTLQQLVQLFSDDRIAKHWSSRLSLSQQSVDNSNWSSGSYSGAARTRVQMVQWRNVVRLDTHWTLTGGADWQHQSIETDGPGAFPNVTRNARAVFAGINGLFGANQLQFNLRHDSVDGLSGQDTGYLGASHALGGGFKVLASYSTAFNAPPLGYLYSDVPNYYIEANPALRPEKAHSSEAGLQWQRGATLLRATLFDTRMTDEWVFGSDPVTGMSQFQNIASSRTRGVELTGSTAWQGWQLDGNLTLQQPVDLSQPGHPTLQRRARSMANLQLSHDWHGVLLGASVHYSGPRPDLDYANYPATPVVLGSYTTVDLSAGGRLAPQWHWNVHVRNLFDKAYQTAYGYNRAPFGVFVGLSWHPPGW